MIVGTPEILIISINPTNVATLLRAEFAAIKATDNSAADTELKDYLMSIINDRYYSIAVEIEETLDFVSAGREE